jgi:Polyketide cyclase / dehydrase and lipid transport
MKFSHTLKTSAAPAKIWAIWTDVAHWSQWDTELADACLDSTFALGSIGTLTPKTGQTSRFEISQLSLGASYTISVQLPLSKLNIYRYLRSQSDGTYFTHEVSFQGLLAFVFGLLLGRKFQKVLPTVMENLKRIAEAEDQ